MASWLNVAFYDLDKWAFSIANSWQKACGGFLNPFFKIISFFGEGGIILLIISILLLLLKRTRKIGLSMLLAIGIGALFTNLILKKSIARARPFNEDITYHQYWILAGKTAVKEFSFPSGHVTVTMTSMTALFLTTDKKKSWIVFIFVALMGLSRIYLIVHYLTDVIGGLIVGGISGTAAFFIVKYIYSMFEKNSKKGFCKFVLNADLIECIKRKQDSKNR